MAYIFFETRKTKDPHSFSLFPLFGQTVTRQVPNGSSEVELPVSTCFNALPDGCWQEISKYPYGTIFCSKEEDTRLDITSEKRNICIIRYPLITDPNGHYLPTSPQPDKYVIGDYYSLMANAKRLKTGRRNDFIMKKLAGTAATTTVKELEHLDQLLSEGIAKFSFRKQDGTIRTAFGTVNGELLGRHAGPAPEPKGVPSAFDPSRMNFFDMEKKEWRCFLVLNYIAVDNDYDI